MNSKYLVHRHSNPNHTSRNYELKMFIVVVLFVVLVVNVQAFGPLRMRMGGRASIIVKMSLEGDSGDAEEVGSGAAVLEQVATPAAAIDTTEPISPAKPVGTAVAAGDMVTGATAPLGVWDPLRIMDQYCGDAQMNLKFRKSLQEAERKHGRVAMLAALGMFVGEKSSILYDHAVTGPAIFQWQQVVAIYPPFQALVLLFIGMTEMNGVIKYWDEPSVTFGNASGLAGLKDSFTPGDYGFDPLNLRPKQPEALKTMINKELNNGRLAMIGVAGIVAQELVTGQSVF